MKLSTRLMAAMIGLAVFTATIIGFLSYRTMEAVTVPLALDHIDARIRLLAAELEASVRSARADVLAFRSAVAIEGIVNASLAGGADSRDGISLDEWRARLARRFVAELASKPSYGQFRVIGLADGGREIVRVDRSGPDGAIRVVPDTELQRQGDRDYFQRAVRLPPDALDISPIELNQEHGVIETPHVPMMQAAASIIGPDGQPFGAIIINVDLRAAFSSIRRMAARTAERIYLANERGDYLIHPDPAKEFGFEFGRSFRIQNDFPELAVDSTAPASPQMVRDRDGQRFGAAMASIRLAEGPRVVLIAMASYSQILATSKDVRDATLAAGLIAILLAIGLAVAITRTLTKPIAKMTSAIDAFGRGAPVLMPTDAVGEIGMLAKAFQRMGSDVREKAAALARESSERRRLFDTSPDLILVTDAQGRFLQVSPSSRTILGYAPSELITRSAVSFVHPEDLDPIRQEMRAARRGRQIRDFATRYMHRGGRVVTLVWSGVWAEPEQRYFFIGRDMTEQKLMEEKFRLAFESSPNGMLMTDADGKILMVNAETEKLFGYSTGELTGHPIDGLVPLRFRDKHPTHRKAFAGKPGARAMGANRDLFGLRKDGTEFPVEVGLNPIQTRDGLVVLSVVVDITERKRIERLKSEFVATVSHELRTPLTSILGSLRLLDSGAMGQVPDPVKRLIKVAFDNSGRLTRLINDILDIEKLEAGKMAFNLKRMQVKGLVEQAIEANAAFAEGFNVKVRLDERAVDVALNVDPDRLTQVMLNLMSNAAKFSPPGQEVLVTICGGSDRVRIGVRDHGPGIPEEFKDRIFEKFAQADATNRRRSGGTGLGLSIVKEIVTRLGGHIGYEAAPGGTIFFVDLPRCQGSGEAGRAEDGVARGGRALDMSIADGTRQPGAAA